MAGAPTLAGTLWLVLQRVASGRHLLQQMQQTNSLRVGQRSQGFRREWMHPVDMQKLHRKDYKASEVTPLTSSLHEYGAKSEYMQPGYGAMPLPCVQWCSLVQSRWAEPSSLTGEIMSGAAQAGASPAPFPSCSSMCLLFTCKMWVSPPCSNRTLKTGTPCYGPALPANIK